MESHFRDLEIVDGYFSGNLCIRADNGDSFSMEFGYDVYTHELKLWNCIAMIVDSNAQGYESYDIAEIYHRFGGWLRNDVHNAMVQEYGPMNCLADGIL